MLGEKGRSRKKELKKETGAEITSEMLSVWLSIFGLLIGLCVIISALFKLTGSASSDFNDTSIVVESKTGMEMPVSSTDSVLELNYPDIIDTLNYVGMQGGKSNLGIVGGVSDIIEVNMLFSSDGSHFTLGDTGISTETAGKLLYTVDIYNNTELSSKYPEAVVMIGAYAEDTLSGFISSNQLTEYLKTGNSYYLGYTNDEDKLKRLSGTYFKCVSQVDNMRVRQSREENGVFRDYREGINALDGFEGYNGKLLATTLEDGSFFNELGMAYALNRLTVSEKEVWDMLLSNIVVGNEVQMVIGIIPDNLLGEDEKADYNKFQTAYVEFTTELKSGNMLTLHIDGFDKFNQKRLSYVAIKTENGKDKLLTQETADILTISFDTLSKFIREEGKNGSIMLDDNIKIGYVNSKSENRENFAGVVYHVGELY